jgi:putative membrane protein
MNHHSLLTMPSALRRLLAAAVLLLPAIAAAQPVAPAPAPPPVPLYRLILDASLFGIAGIALLIVGYYIWEIITPYNVRKELQEQKNVAVAIVVAAFIVGMAIVIAASLILIK